jgi:hypothetical protein
LQTLHWDGEAWQGQTLYLIGPLAMGRKGLPGTNTLAHWGLKLHKKLMHIRCNKVLWDYPIKLFLEDLSHLL